jgi:hypothetical protein
MNYLKYYRGLPKRIACDNGSEFSPDQMDRWAYNNHEELDFSRRGKPTEGRLNAHWFESLEDAKTADTRRLGRCLACTKLCSEPTGCPQPTVASQ